MLFQLYKDAIQTFNQSTEIEQQIGNGFAWMQASLPHLQIPAFYFHVSVFSQNVLVADSLISLSIDKYLE